MGNPDARHSVLRLSLELAEQFVVLVFLELKLAVLEVRGNIKSIEKGAVLLAMGAVLLILAALTLIGTAIAAFAIILPVWLAALIVSIVLLCLGSLIVVTGLGKVKHFTLAPTETLARIRIISEKLKAHAERHGH